jgi:hypothetical protein
MSRGQAAEATAEYQSTKEAVLRVEAEMNKKDEVNRGIERRIKEVEGQRTEQVELLNA